MNRLAIIAISVVAVSAPVTSANLSDTPTSAPPPLVLTADQPAKKSGHKSATVVKVRTIRSGIDDNSLVAASANMGNQLICRTHKAEGSRIKRNRCLTTAEWKKEKETRMLRANLIKGSGRPPAWRTP